MNEIVTEMRGYQAAVLGLMLQYTVRAIKFNGLMLQHPELATAETVQLSTDFVVAEHGMIDSFKKGMGLLTKLIKAVENQQKGGGTSDTERETGKANQPDAGAEHGHEPNGH